MANPAGLCTPFKEQCVSANIDDNQVLEIIFDRSFDGWH